MPCRRWRRRSPWRGPRCRIRTAIRAGRPTPSSKLLETTVASYRRLFGDEPKVKAIHAGLECGLFLEKYPELEMVSFGPTLRGVHSPDERLEIATVPRFWELLSDILRHI